MKKILIVCLLAVLLCSVVLHGGAALAAAKLDTYTLYIYVNTGVSSVTVNNGIEDVTYTTSTSITVLRSSVTWSATAKDGYTMDESSGTLTLVSDDLNTLSPTASEIVVTKYKLYVNLGTGVKSVKVIVNSTTYNFSSSSYMTVDANSSISWSATAASGYKTSSGGGFVLTQETTISATATVESFTVTATVTPSDASCTLGWTLAWVSGKSLSGSVSDYVTMTVASDGKSVTLTFVKDFSAGEMVLTCYATADPTVKATCTVKCGS